LSLALLYVLGINVFLSTPLFGRVVNAKPDIVDVHYERAWSLLPWSIHARKLSVRGRDGDVEWMLRLDEVEFGVSFAALVRMRFEATHVRGQGVSFRLRQRLSTPPASPDEVADLPPIEGLPPYSLRPPEKPNPAKWSDAGYDLWTAHLEDVIAAGTREVWIDHARFEGDARIEGRFFLKPMRAVEVGPVRVAVATGEVRTGRGPIAGALDGSTLDATVARFDPRAAGGAEILHRASLDADVHAVVPEAGRFRALPEGTTAEGEVKVEHAALRVRSGRLASGSHLEARVAPLGVSRGAYRATGTLAFVADVLRDADTGHDRLTFRATGTDLLAFRGRRTFLLARRLNIAGDAGALDLVRPFEDLHLVVDLTDGALPDVRSLSRAIPASADVALEGGHARATARLEAWLAEKRAAGSGDLSAEDLDLRVARMRVRGHASIAARFSSYHFGARRLEDAAVSLTVSDGYLASNAAPGSPLIHVGRLRLNAHGRSVELARPLEALDVTIAMPQADVLAPDLLHAYLPKGHAMRLVSGHARFSLEAGLVLAHGLARGSLDVQSRGLTVGYRDLRLRADVRARASVRDWLLDTGDVVLRGASVDVERGTVTSRGAELAREVPALSFVRIGVAAKSPRFKMTDPLARVSLSASLAGAKVHHPAGLGAFLPEETALLIESREGGFDAEARVEVERHVADGRVHARAYGMGAGGKTVHIGGNVDLLADVGAWDLDGATLSLRDSRVTVTRVEGRFHPEGGPEFSAARVALEASQPRLDLRSPTLRGADFHLIIEDAVLPDARVLSALLPPGGDTSIEAGVGRVSADLSLSTSRESAAGTLDVRLARGALRLGGMLVAGDFRLRGGLRGFRPAEDLVGLSDARLEMRNVSVTGASATTSAWRGDVTLSGGSLRLAPAPRLEGAVRVEARDARPILALVFGNDFPGILVRLTDVPRLIGSAQVMVGTDRWAVLDLDAGGGSVWLRGDYAETGGRRRGGLIARKWFLSVGVGLDDDGTHLRLFGLDGWLRDQRRAVVKLLDGQGRR
jgi:hypothetical protein